MIKLRTTEEGKLFRETIIYGKLPKLEVSILVAHFSFLSPNPLSLRYHCQFFGHFLGHPATSGSETGSKFFVSSFSSILYHFLAMNRSVEGEIKERSLLEITKKSSSLPTTFLADPLQVVSPPLVAGLWRIEHLEFRPLRDFEENLWSSSPIQTSWQV